MDWNNQEECQSIVSCVKCDSIQLKKKEVKARQGDEYTIFRVKCEKCGHAWFDYENN